MRHETPTVLNGCTGPQNTANTGIFAPHLIHSNSPFRSQIGSDSQPRYCDKRAILDSHEIADLLAVEE